MSSFSDEADPVPLAPNLAAIVEVLSTQGPISKLEGLLTPSIKVNEPLRANRTLTMMHLAASHSPEATVLLVNHGGRVLGKSSVLHYAAEKCSAAVLEVLLHQMLKEASPRECLEHILTPVMKKNLLDTAQGDKAQIVKAFIEKLKSS